MDNVNNPSHYNFGDIEVIDYIRDKLTKEQFTGYCLGNVLKYVSRWEHKGGLEDLKKAKVYLGWAIGRNDINSAIKPTKDGDEKKNDGIKHIHVNQLGEPFGYCQECHISGRLYAHPSGKKLCAKCWSKEEDDLK